MFSVKTFLLSLFPFWASVFPVLGISISVLQVCQNNYNSHLTGDHTYFLKNKKSFVLLL